MRSSSVSPRTNSSTREHVYYWPPEEAAFLRPEESFKPIVENALAPDDVIIVHDAAGGQPIRRWHKGWKPASGDAPELTGDLSDRLWHRVQEATAGRTLSSVTFVWMQGERDAHEQHGDVYAASLRGLIDQLAKDLGRDDLHFVIGRLSDFDLDDARYRHWTNVRTAQVAVAERDPRGAWADTDDLNDGANRRGKEIRNDLHYSAQGCVTLGRRFAEEALQLLAKR